MVIPLRRLSFFFHLCKALAAINRAVFSWLERNLCLFAAACANSGEHLSVRFFAGLAGVAAGFASLRLVLESLFSVEFLLASSENELGSAFFAYSCFVFVHSFYTSLYLFAHGPEHWRRFA